MDIVGYVNDEDKDIKIKSIDCLKTLKFYC